MSNNYNSEYTRVFKKSSVTISVVGHGEEMGYIYYRFDLNQSGAAETSPEKKTLNRMVKMWTNFAKSGLVSFHVAFLVTQYVLLINGNIILTYNIFYLSII